MATPAEVVRAYIVTKKQAVYPGIEQQPDFGPVQCFVGELGTDIDRALAVMDMAGSYQGRSQWTGGALVHRGFKVFLRSLRQEDGDKIYDIESFINGTTSPFDVRVRDNYIYHVHSIYTVGDVVALGEEKGTKRKVWILNGRMSFQEPNRTKLED